MPNNTQKKTGPNTVAGKERKGGGCPPPQTRETGESFGGALDTATVLRDARKDKSSQNSTTHGLRSEHFRLLKGESQEEFDKVHQRWIARYGSDDPGILLLIEKLAQDDWTVRRAMRSLCNLQERLLEAESDNQSEEVIQNIERRLALTVRYKTSLENSFKRTLQQIEAIFARHKKEELKERVVFMRECVLAQQIVIDQRKAGIPAFLPWPVNIYDRKKYPRTKDQG